jgi:uncharacterized membrane protein YphA (DoxX/SURF4 family)
MEYLFLLGRVLYGGFFLFTGLEHLTRPATMTPYAAAKGVPAPKLAVLGSGVLVVFGGLSILFGLRPDWGVGLLVLFLIPTTVTMHNFWADVHAAHDCANA